MTYTPVIYDWRPTIEPLDQIFWAGGASVSGGMTLGGASVENPEPGGRASLEMNFARLALATSNLDASWLISRILNGNILRIPLFTPSVQLVTDAVLGVSATGVTWSNGLGWSLGQNWRSNPTAAITVAGVKGGTTCTVNLTGLANALQLGHVIGFHLSGYDFAHVIMDIAYNTAGTSAAITVSPPLRRDVPTTARLTFRPIMLATCLNPNDVRDNFRWGQTMQLNTAKWAEALV